MSVILCMCVCVFPLPIASSLINHRFGPNYRNMDKLEHEEHVLSGRAREMVQMMMMMKNASSSRVQFIIHCSALVQS